MTPDSLCIGAFLWDMIGRTGHPMPPGSDQPGRITRMPGGVALNIAATLARQGLRPAILTAVGTDPEGDELLSACAALGMDVAHVHRSATHPTDRYMAIEGPDGLVAAIADAHSLEAAGAAILAPLSDGRLGSLAAPWTGPVALDGNLTEALLSEIAASPLFARARLAVAPASPGKALRLLTLLGHPASCLYVNLAEARLLCNQPLPDAATAAQALVAEGAPRALVTDGGRLVADADRTGVFQAVPPQVSVARVTGAGDTFMATHLVAEARGAPREAALARALDAAAAFVAGGHP